MRSVFQTKVLFFTRAGPSGPRFCFDKVFAVVE